MDNSLLKLGDKLGKTQLIYDELNKKFHQFGIFHNKLNMMNQSFCVMVTNLLKCIF